MKIYTTFCQKIMIKSVSIKIRVFKFYALINKKDTYTIKSSIR